MHVVERTYDFATIVAERVRTQNYHIPIVSRRTAPNRNKINALAQFNAAVAERGNGVANIKDAYEVAYGIVVRDLANADKSDDERRHLAEVARHMQSIVHARLQCEQQRVSEERPQTSERHYEQRRLQRLHVVRESLESVARQFEQVNELVSGQMTTIASIERSVASISVRIDASSRELEDAAPRVYHRLHYNLQHVIAPRTFSGKLRLGVAAFACFYCALFVLGLI